MQERRLGERSTRTTQKRIFEYIPFADHNAMIDPPTVDITGRILEMLAQLRVYAPRTSVLKKAVQFILKRAGAGRKLVRTLGRELSVWNIPGTALGWRLWAYWNHEPAVQQASRVDPHGAEMPDGGWGETCGSV